MSLLPPPTVSKFDLSLGSDLVRSGRSRSRLRYRLSLSAKLWMTALILLTVPVIVFARFRAADEVQQSLLLRSVREQGHITAEALAPLLKDSDRVALPQLGYELERLSDDVASVKLLFEPPDRSGFFYVASWPTVPNSQLETERATLTEAGVLERLTASCEGEVPLALHYRAPERDEQIVTSVMPLRTTAGCWVFVTTLSADLLPGMSIGRPYWKSQDVRIAAAIYLAMIFFIFTTFWSIRRGLKRFVEHARAIRDHQPGISFADQNDVPDLAEAAVEFDHMVDVLATSAQDLRRAAEDNAHAFKTPIAVIRQSLEPLRRGIDPQKERNVRALRLIENSLDKLDELVASARRLDEAAAILLDMPRSNVDLSNLLRRLVEASSDALARRGIRLKHHILPDVMVCGHEEMVETVVENLFDNAVSFSPAGGSIELTLAVGGDLAQFLIANSGPGVPAEYMERIFERYFSYRPSHHVDVDSLSHFGVGLWIAKHNVEALGGTIRAENRSPNGLLVQVALRLVEGKSRPAAITSQPRLVPSSIANSLPSATKVRSSGVPDGDRLPARFGALPRVAAIAACALGLGWAGVAAIGIESRDRILADVVEWQRLLVEAHDRVSNSVEVAPRPFSVAAAIVPIPAPAAPNVELPIVSPEVAASHAEAAANMPAAAKISSKPISDDTEWLLVDGDALLSQGDIASARLFFERAADAGNAHAALRMGRTFDPVFLSRLGVVGMKGDDREAALWYWRAHELGEDRDAAGVDQPLRRAATQP